MLNVVFGFEFRFGDRFNDQFGIGFVFLSFYNFSLTSCGPSLVSLVVHLLRKGTYLS